MYPASPRVIDLFLSIPPDDASFVERFPGVANDHYAADRKHGHDFMFRGIPEIAGARFERVLLTDMDRNHIERALIPVTFDEPIGRGILERNPDRFVGSYAVDPNAGMRGVRDLERACREFTIAAAAAFPAGYAPQVPIDDRRFFPLYAKCIELDIPMFITAGVPGPRFRMDCQRVDRLDEVCWFFPELTVITRHGCEPWVELAVKLMLKYPNLYYSTSGFAPKYYPPAIIDYANTRGADKIMYAGYFPAGLSYERIFSELPDVPLRAEVWPKFLYENAARVLKLPTPAVTA